MSIQNVGKIISEFVSVVFVLMHIVAIWFNGNYCIFIVTCVVPIVSLHCSNTMYLQSVSLKCIILFVIFNL